jgi:hypothetical protein
MAARRTKVAWSAGSGSVRRMRRAIVSRRAETGTFRYRTSHWTRTAQVPNAQRSRTVDYRRAPGQSRTAGRHVWPLQTSLVRQRHVVLLPRDDSQGCVECVRFADLDVGRTRDGSRGRSTCSRGEGRRNALKDRRPGLRYGSRCRPLNALGSADGMPLRLEARCDRFGSKASACCIRWRRNFACSKQRHGSDLKVVTST